MDTDDITPYLREALPPIREQLRERLEAEPLSDSDDLAIASALALALIAGFKQGVASIQYSAIQQGTNLTYSLREGLEVEADLWAERYGNS
jgi:hypothetical protein